MNTAIEHCQISTACEQEKQIDNYQNLICKAGVDKILTISVCKESGLINRSCSNQWNRQRIFWTKDIRELEKWTFGPFVRRQLYFCSDSVSGNLSSWQTFTSTRSKKFTVTDFREKRFPEENQETVLAGKNGQTEKWAELAQKWMESLEKLFAEKTKTLQRTDKNYTRQLTLSHRFSLIIVLLTQLAVHWQQNYEIRELPLGITGGSGNWTFDSGIMRRPCSHLQISNRMPKFLNFVKINYSTTEFVLWPPLGVFISKGRLWAGSQGANRFCVG